MKIVTEYPYEEFSGYLVTNPENRKNVCLVHNKTKAKTTVSYARYLMSVHQKRILSKDEHVDHIDNDKTNDTISNLQIVTIAENNRKQKEHAGIPKAEYYSIKCPNCNTVFRRLYWNTHLCREGTLITCCSRSCSWAIRKKGLSKEELTEIGNNQFILTPV